MEHLDETPLVRLDAARIARDQRIWLATFTATIFLSASLLFTVQPMFARVVLPRLGGSPSVWAVSMCFFQAVLLAGYCYAHLLNRYFDPPRAVLAHLALLAVTLLALPIGLPADVSAPPASREMLWLIGVLWSGVGLPFFAVSASAPLLQSWFGRMGHPQSADPYFLYGASNIGSLLALLSYPVLMEPLLGLHMQTELWSKCFLLLGCSIAACGALMLGVDRQTADRSTSGGSAARLADPSRAVSTEALDCSRRGVWMALAFVPSALLVAVTTYISTDIVSAPFMWVLPLAAFLLTFPLVFRDKPIISHEALADRQPILAALAIFATPAIGQLAFGIGYASAMLAFVVTCLVCHRELYLRRPQTGHLTEFYMWMSAGGVLGGIFSALLAPLVFPVVIEFPLLLAASTIFRPQLLGDAEAPAGSRRRAALLLGCGLLVVLALRLVVSSGAIQPNASLYLTVVAAPLAAVVLWHRFPHAQVASVALMMMASLLMPCDGTPLHVVRSFFGVHRVVETAGGEFRVLMHGTTVHGARRIATSAGVPIADPAPATYYHASGPINRSTELVRRTPSAPRFGIVGLGSGAIACWSRPGERWRFFEIDQAVIDIARNPRYFDFLSSCQPDAPIVVGDARLTLAKEPHAAFDYLLIDAFSSDSIPTHLLTVDALRMYLDRVSEDGVIVFHVSNRHLDLAPVVAANATSLGLSAVIVDDEPPSAGLDATPSTAVLVARRRQVLEPALSWPGAAWASDDRWSAGAVRAWSDDYSDVLSALARRLGK